MTTRLVPRMILAGCVIGVLALAVEGRKEAVAEDQPLARRTTLTSAPVVLGSPPYSSRLPARAGGTLGSGFVSTPYIFVRGNGTAGGGYSPLGTFGDTTTSLYGPLSSFRATAAPVLTYSRGYDGVLRPEVGTSFSTPNMPSMSPVVYPTQANNFDRPRTPVYRPWWPSAINWLDQN